jgi:hypothetical protein
MKHLRVHNIAGWSKLASILVIVANYQAGVACSKPTILVKRELLETRLQSTPWTELEGPTYRQAVRSLDD